MGSGHEQQGSPSDQFVQLFTQHQRRVYHFILGQVPNPSDAEEVLQETNVVLLRKCDQFQEGTNFLAWACSVARYEVLKHRDRFKRDRLQFSSEFLDLMQTEVVRRDETSEARRDALTACVGKLSEKDRKLIKLRYAPGSNGQSVAETIGRPPNSVYQSLSRIRRALLDCVNRTLTAQSLR